MTTHTITANDADQRVDRFLRKLYPGMTMGDIFSALRKGKVKLNGKKTSHNARVQVGDIIELFIDKTVTSEAQKKPNRVRTVTKKLETSRIIYEDDHILAYDKPAGLVVHETDHKTDEVSLIEQVLEYLGQAEGLTFTPALAHRIDRETSGIILIAKSKQALESLTLQFKKRTVQKHYQCLVHGVLKEKEGTIDAPLHRSDETRKDKPKVFVDITNGLSASTRYLYENSYTYEDHDFCLVSCYPKSGRMHQIRVHMAYIGHALVGDRRYLPSALRKADSQILQYLYKSKQPYLGHLLHAYEITFEHPMKGSMTLKCDWKLLKNL